MNIRSVTSGMRAILFFLLFLFCTASLTADGFVRARSVLAHLQAGRGDSLSAMLHPSVRAQLPVPVLSVLWTEIEGKTGKLLGQGSWRTRRTGGFRQDLCRLEFEKAALDFTLTFDDSLRVAGLFFSPAAPLPVDTAAAAPSGCEERQLTVSCGPVRLGATLCLPSARRGQVPCVVLVQGSGPSDRDETMGRIRPFRTLAHALAARGIATLRYDKRTFVYGARMAEVSGEVTLDTEVTDDACAALSLAAACPETDSTRLFVLGHSLGGKLAPRIASRSRFRPAGIISLAGPVRTLTELMREQLCYLRAVSGGSQAGADSLLSRLTESLPEEYLASERAYDALATVRSLCPLPMLFLGGGHDYQVTRCDFDLWKQALSGCPAARFVWLPACDHLMRLQPEMAVPETYTREAPLSPDALAAIEDFVNN